VIRLTISMQYVNVTETSYHNRGHAIHCRTATTCNCTFTDVTTNNDNELQHLKHILTENDIRQRSSITGIKKWWKFQQQL